MANFKDITQVNRYLDGIPSFQKYGAAAARLGLDRIQSFCDIMGNPERNITCVHIAGTNGKGSVGAMLALVYEKAGYRCGLYTSPHLETVRERFRINRKMISENEMLHFFRTYGTQLESLKLSYFEITTALAFWWFSEENTDIVVLETGLGGRLDATNIVDPAVSVITSISHDHQNFLGRTLREIASEKGGIIKPGRPVVIGNMSAGARNTLISIAAQRGAELRDARMLKPRFFRPKTFRRKEHVPGRECIPKNEYIPGMKHNIRGDSGSIMIEPGNIVRFRDENRLITVATDLDVPVNRWNIAVAWGVTRCIIDSFPVPESVFCDSLKSVRRSGILPGRFERLAPDRHWYFDGAHNPEAVRALVSFIKTQDWEQQPVIVLSLMKDKVQKKIIYPFSVFKKNYYYVMNSERAADFPLITPYLSNLTSLPPSEEEIIDFFARLTKQVVIFTGSFYFYCVVKRWVSSIIKTK